MAELKNARYATLDAHEDDNIALWERAVDALVAGGATPAEAIDGANLIAQAARRKRAEIAANPMRASGIRKREK